MQPLKTFIIEDSAVIRESLIATLEELAPIVVVGSAEDESSAMQWLAAPAHEADLVILDLFLKGGSGLGVLRAAQSLPVEVRMLVLTNYATDAIRKKCLGLGADRVFDKSSEIDALIHYCKELQARSVGVQ